MLSVFIMGSLAACGEGGVFGNKNSGNGSISIHYVAVSTATIWIRYPPTIKPKRALP